MTEQQKINWKRSGDIPVLQDVSKGAVHMLQFPLLEQQSWISHGFSTRMGGVSEGCYASMNLSFTKGDDPEKVRENYRRLADMLGMDMERMTLSFQTHTTNVRLVTEEDAGKGIVKERDYTDVDGLITNIPGTTLVTFYADCVPLYFVDPVHRKVLPRSRSFRLEGNRSPYGPGNLKNHEGSLWNKTGGRDLCYRSKHLPVLL